MKSLFTDYLRGAVGGENNLSANPNQLDAKCGTLTKNNSPVDRLETRNVDESIPFRVETLPYFLTGESDIPKTFFFSNKEEARVHIGDNRDHLFKAGKVGTKSIEKDMKSENILSLISKADSSIVQDKNKGKWLGAKNSFHRKRSLFSAYGSKHKIFPSTKKILVRRSPLESNQTISGESQLNQTSLDKLTTTPKKVATAIKLKGNKELQVKSDDVKSLRAQLTEPSCVQLNKEDSKPKWNISSRLLPMNSHLMSPVRSRQPRNMLSPKVQTPPQRPKPLVSVVSTHPQNEPIKTQKVFSPVKTPLDSKSHLFKPMSTLRVANQTTNSMKPANLAKNSIPPIRPPPYLLESKTVACLTKLKIKEMKSQKSLLLPKIPDPPKPNPSQSLKPNQQLRGLISFKNDPKIKSVLNSKDLRCPPSPSSKSYKDISKQAAKVISPQTDKKKVGMDAKSPVNLRQSGICVKKDLIRTPQRSIKIPLQQTKSIVSGKFAKKPTKLCISRVFSSETSISDLVEKERSMNCENDCDEQKEPPVEPTNNESNAISGMPTTNEDPKGELKLNAAPFKFTSKLVLYYEQLKHGVTLFPSDKLEFADQNVEVQNRELPSGGKINPETPHEHALKSAKSEGCVATDTSEITSANRKISEELVLEIIDSMDFEKLDEKVFSNGCLEAQVESSKVEESDTNIPPNIDTNEYSKVLKESLEGTNKDEVIKQKEITYAENCGITIDYNWSGKGVEGTEVQVEPKMNEKSQAEEEEMNSGTSDLEVLGEPIRKEKDVTMDVERKIEKYEVSDMEQIEMPRMCFEETEHRTLGFDNEFSTDLRMEDKGIDEGQSVFAQMGKDGFRGKECESHEIIFKRTEKVSSSRRRTVEETPLKMSKKQHSSFHEKKIGFAKKFLIKVKGSKHRVTRKKKEHRSIEKSHFFNKSKKQMTLEEHKVTPIRETGLEKVIEELDKDQSYQHGAVPPLPDIDFKGSTEINISPNTSSEHVSQGEKNLEVIFEHSHFPEDSKELFECPSRSHLSASRSIRILNQIWTSQEETDEPILLRFKMNQALQLAERSSEEPLTPINRSFIFDPPPNVQIPFLPASIYANRTINEEPNDNEREGHKFVVSQTHIASVMVAAALITAVFTTKHTSIMSLGQYIKSFFETS